MSIPELVWCQAGNPRFAALAVAAGFRYGARLPGTTYAPVWFADQHYRAPDRRAYMRALVEHRPACATVLDWEREEQLPEELDWAEEAAQYCRRVILIPKVTGGVRRLPRQIGGRDVAIGYSMPSAYGSTSVPIWECFGWPVHVLGGEPQEQMTFWRRLRDRLDVVSVDGNVASLMATRYAKVWVPGSGNRARSRWWVSLSSLGDERRQGAPDEALRRSLTAIRQAWERVEG